MDNRLNNLLENHRLLASETWHQLNELSKANLVDVSVKEISEVELSIQELQLEYSLRRSFINELETLL